MLDYLSEKATHNDILFVDLTSIFIPLSTQVRFSAEQFIIVFFLFLFLLVFYQIYFRLALSSLSLSFKRFYFTGIFSKIGEAFWISLDALPVQQICPRSRREIVNPE